VPEDVFDQEAWLARIGYIGPRTPTLETLRALIAAHTAAIPFENIDPFVGRVPKLDLASLQAKIVSGGRGGYCYEQNMLLRAGLTALGYPVTSLLARVIRNMTIDAARPATHMVLRVDLQQGTFLADVGFGNLTPTAPLGLRPDVEQETPHEVMRLMPVGEELTLQARIGDEWQSVYRVTPQARLDADYEIANWFVATHPNSLFIANMIVGRPGPDGVRHTLLNGLLSARRGGELVERRMLDDAASHAEALRHTFGLVLSDADMAAAWKELDRRGSLGKPHPFVT
jgi:N-hydroxyarylamine O-acetyltransferase